jgi:hypothetical protein
MKTTFVMQLILKLDLVEIKRFTHQQEPAAALLNQRVIIVGATLMNLKMIPVDAGIVNYSKIKNYAYTGRAKINSSTFFK